MRAKPKPKAKRQSPTRQRTPTDAAARALPSASHELLLMDEVTARARLSGTTLWRLEKAGRFPKRQKIGFKRVAWRAAEIDDWIAGRWVAPAAEPVAA